MKLLLDENLSDRIVPKIIGFYPGSTHVKAEGLLQTDDSLVWTFAQNNHFVIVSKDADFHQRSMVFGHPPKFIYLRVGNCSTERLIELIRSNTVLILAFGADQTSSILVLER